MTPSLPASGGIQIVGDKVVIESSDSQFGIDTTNAQGTTPVVYTGEIFLESPTGHQYKAAAESITFTVTVSEPCISELPSVDGADAIFHDSRTQPVWQSASSILWSDSDASFASIDASQCGPLAFDVVNQSDSLAPTSSVFASSLTGAPNYELTIYTEDAAAAQEYGLQVRVWLKNFATFGSFRGTNDFKVTVVDNCRVSTGMQVQTSQLSDLSYIVGSAQEIISADAAFSVTPDYCQTHLKYSLSTEPKLSSAGVFTIDEDQGLLTINSDSAAVGVFTVKISVLDHSGADSGVSSSFNVEFIDPCIQTTIESREGS